MNTSYELNFNEKLRHLIKILCCISDLNHFSISENMSLCFGSFQEYAKFMSYIEVFYNFLPRDLIEFCKNRGITCPSYNTLLDFDFNKEKYLKAKNDLVSSSLEESYLKLKKYRE